MWHKLRELFLTYEEGNSDQYQPTNIRSDEDITRSKGPTFENVTLKPCVEVISYSFSYARVLPLGQYIAARQR